MRRQTKDSRVSVAVRLKPEARNYRRCLSITQSNSKVIEVGEKRFEFDQVYGEEGTQADIYESSVRKLVDGCFKGFNGTVFAYGQTGSGKTFTTMGLPHDDEDEGIIPRALRHIFQYLAETSNNGHRSRDDNALAPLFQLASVHVSFIEIYNEECRDLLHPDIPGRDIMIREDKDGRIFFTGARDEVVGDTEAAINLLEIGNVQRTTAGTFMNATSSRSHAIFTVSLELFEYPKGNSDGNYHDKGGPGREGTGTGTGTGTGDDCSAGRYIQSKLHLVDLAGSERAKRTLAEGKRLKESVGINQGLLALGKVIRALTLGANQGQSHGYHVPYRESKLTRFLQDSLGGNSQTLMLACVSPSDVNAHESLSTLQYAARARAVQNKAIANVRKLPTSMSARNIDETVSGTANGGESTKAWYGGSHDAGPHEFMRDGVESSLVSALRFQLGRLQEEMALLRDQRAEKRRRGSSIGEHMTANNEDAEVLRASVNSLYDSISENQWADTENREKSNLLVNELASPKASDGDKNEAEIVDGKQIHTLEKDLAVTLMKLETTQKKLDEANDDLLQDEEVFREKAREVKRLRKANKHLQGLVDDLKLENEHLLQRLNKTERNSSSSPDWGHRESTSIPGSIPRGDSSILDGDKGRRPGTMESVQSVESAAESVVFTADEAVSRTLNRRTHPSKVEKSDHSWAENEQAELSMAVIDSEPHISSLMEDLEAVQLEKEMLMKHNAEVERMYTQALAKLAELNQQQQKQQQEHSVDDKNGEIDGHQDQDTKGIYSDPSRRLRELEAGIKLKQECINALASQEREAQRQKEEYAQKAILLEGTAEALRNQLQTVNKEMHESRISKEQALIEKEKRESISKQLFEVKEAKRALEKALSVQKKREQRVREEANKGEQYLQELSDLRTEHAKLMTQLSQGEGRFRKVLDSLTAEVNTYKSQAEASKTRIEMLEGKNKELTIRLQRSARQLNNNKSGTRGAPGSAGMLEDGDTVFTGGSSSRGSGDNYSGQPQSRVGSVNDNNASEHRGKRVAFGSSVSQSKPASGRALNADNTIVHAQVGVVDESEARRLADHHLTWLASRVQELTHARLATREVARLKSKLTELKKEKESTLTEYNTLVQSQRRAEHTLRDTLVGLDVKLQKIGKQMDDCLAGSRRHKELSGVKSALMEHKQEIETRLASGILSKDKVHALHDLAEEAETLQAEIELNSVRLAEEQRRVAKGQGAGEQGMMREGEHEGALLAAELMQRKAALVLLSPSTESSTTSQASFVSEINQRMLCRAMAKVSMLAVEARYQWEQSKLEIQELRCHLDEKDAEASDWQEAAQTLKMEHTRKLAEVRKEGEQKVNTLLKQLRAMEARNLETANLLRKSTEYSNNLAVPERRMVIATEGTDTLMPSVGVHNPSQSTEDLQPEIYQSYDERMPYSRPRSALSPPGSPSRPSVSSQHLIRRMSDHDLSLDLKGGGNTGTRSNFHNGSDTDNGQLRASEEVLARWSAEKERRLQLEKRNSELVKELRSVRTSIDAGSYSASRNNRK